MSEAVIPRRTAQRALLLALLAAGSAAACEPFPLKNQSLAEVEAGTFESRNGEFSVALPFDKQRVEFGSYDNRCFYAINIDSLTSSGHQSVEWVYFERRPSTEEFSAYWKGFIDDYLAKNFGKGGYVLSRMEEYTTPEGRQAFRYAGSGTNHSGGEGAIHGVVMHFGERMANVYTITPGPILDEGRALEGAAAQAARRTADSLACTSATCRADAPSPTDG